MYVCQIQTIFVIMLQVLLDFVSELEGEGRGGEGMEIPQLVWESKNEEGKVMAGLYGYFLFYPFLLKINILPSIS